ncbi:MAG: hypothetical protein KC414_08450 [Romboutsia sp.]|nr:hypothetical protein [Romboutsia sp.]
MNDSGISIGNFEDDFKDNILQDPESTKQHIYNINKKLEVLGAGFKVRSIFGKRYFSVI